MQALYISDYILLYRSSVCLLLVYVTILACLLSDQKIRLLLVREMGLYIQVN